MRTADKLEAKEQKLRLRQQFYLACKQGDILEFNRLIDLVDPRTEFNIALSLAAGLGHLDMVKRLIPVTDPKRDQSDAFRKAVLNDHKECAYALLPHSDPHAVGNQALRYAAQNAWHRSFDPFEESRTAKDVHYDLVLKLINDARVSASMDVQAYKSVIRHDWNAIATNNLLQNVSLSKFPDAVIIAAKHGEPESVAVILEHVCPSQVSNSLLKAAVEGQSVEVLRLVFPHSDPRDHSDALHAAIEEINSPFGDMFGSAEAFAKELHQLIADYERKEMFNEIQAAHGIEQLSKKRRM